MVGRAGRYDPQPFEENLKRFSGFHCSDPRDRLFALVGITDWGCSGCGRIVPDYTKSAWGLALEIGPTLDYGWLHALVHALEITSETEEVASPLQEQRSRVSMQTMQAVELDAHRESPTVRGQKFEEILCLRLRATASDGLCANIDVHGRGHHTEDFHLSTQALDSIRGDDDSPHQIAQPVINRHGKVIALVCLDARPNDILVEVQCFSGLLFIVRASQTKNMHYDLIGQGLVIGNYKYGGLERPSCPPGPCSCSPEVFARRSSFMADVNVALTIEELIVLVAQHNPNMKEESRIAAGLARMVTGPTTRPRNAVSITNFICESLWSITV